MFYTIYEIQYAFNSISFRLMASYFYLKKRRIKNIKLNIFLIFFISHLCIEHGFHITSLIKIEKYLHAR